MYGVILGILEILILIIIFVNFLFKPMGPLWTTVKLLAELRSDGCYPNPVPTFKKKYRIRSSRKNRILT